MKKVRVEAFIPQLAAAHAYQETEGSGSSLAVAIGRAVDALLAKPVVKGRRVKAMSWRLWSWSKGHYGTCKKILHVTSSFLTFEVLSSDS